MLVYISHSGSADHNKVVRKISNYLENEYGITCEYIIDAEDSPISLINDDGESITQFKSEPSNGLLDFYILPLFEKSNKN